MPCQVRQHQIWVFVAMSALENQTWQRYSSRSTQVAATLLFEIDPKTDHITKRGMDPLASTFTMISNPEPSALSMSVESYLDSEIAEHWQKNPSRRYSLLCRRAAKASMKTNEHYYHQLAEMSSIFQPC